MDVLQAPVVETARHIHAQVVLHLAVPQSGNVFGLDFAGNQCAFYLEAQDDMRRVGQLVGIDADESAVYLREQTRQVGSFKGRLCPEVFLHQWRDQLQEGRAAAQLHFKRQALALVYAHGAGAAHWQEQRVTRQALLIAGVPGFVDDAHQAGRKGEFTVARSDAHVLRHTAAEWVGGNVQPAAFKIKAQYAHHLNAQRTLFVDGKRGLRLQYGFTLLLGYDLADQIGQPGFDGTKQRADSLLCHARLEFIHQRFVGGAAGGISQEFGLLTRQADNRAKVTKKPLPIVGPTLRAPAMLAAGTCQTLRFNQVLWQAVDHGPFPAHLRQTGLVDF